MSDFETNGVAVPAIDGVAVPAIDGVAVPAIDGVAVPAIAGGHSVRLCRGSQKSENAGRSGPKDAVCAWRFTKLFEPRNRYT